MRPTLAVDDPRALLGRQERRRVREVDEDCTPGPSHVSTHTAHMSLVGTVVEGFTH